jgi:hypothetical protein
MCLLVATIALGALSAVRARARAAKARNDALEARLYALAATEVARIRIAHDTTWRSDYANGTWFTNESIGRGTYSLSVVDPNGPLNGSPTDPVILTGTGAVGQALQTTQVTLVAKSTPYTCLNAAVTAGGFIGIGNSIIQANNQTLATNFAAWAFGAVVNGNVEAANSIFGFTYNGTTKTSVAARTLPDATVFSDYQTSGTAINYNSIPSNNIQQVLLSPSINPYGATNANGIYVVDCQGGNMNIQQCRIVGTLVLLNAGNVQIQNQVVWSPAVANYPCLLIDGDLTVNSNGNYLTEGGGENYNPPGTPYPYPSGFSNMTTTDTYVPAVQGMVYLAGNLTVQGNVFAANLLVVGGSLSMAGGATLYMSYDPIYYNNPPPGFGTVSMVVSPGSWQQVTH